MLRGVSLSARRLRDGPGGDRDHSRIGGALADSSGFILTTSSCWSFWRKSRTKASFSHLQLSVCEGSLARKLRFHIFNFHFWREVSHESFVFTSSTFTFWGTSCTKASFSHLQLSFLREGSHEMRSWEIADARNVVFCRSKRASEDGRPWASDIDYNQYFPIKKYWYWFSKKYWLFQYFGYWFFGENIDFNIDFDIDFLGSVGGLFMCWKC